MCVRVVVVVVYYLNHMQKTTQWDRPMPAAPAPGFVVDHGARVASAMPSSGAGLMDGGFVKKSQVIIVTIIIIYIYMYYITYTCTYIYIYTCIYTYMYMHIYIGS